MIIKTPFDILNILGKPKYDEVSTIDKKRHCFIVNRMLSRGLPEVAQNLNHMKGIPESILDFWNLTFIELQGSPHGMRVLNGIRKALRVSMAGAKKKATKKKPPKDIVNKFIELSKISPKEYEIIEMFFQKELIKYLKDVEKMLKTSK